MSPLEYGSQDVIIATQNAIREVLPSATVYTNALPASGVIFPHFHIQELQVTPVIAPRKQIRDKWRIDNYFITIKWRVVSGAALAPANLQAQLRNTRHELSRIDRLRLGAASIPVEWSYIEPEPDATGHLILGAYFNAKVWVRIDMPKAPMQENLEYTINANESKMVGSV